VPQQYCLAVVCALAFTNVSILESRSVSTMSVAMASVRRAMTADRSVDQPDDGVRINPGRRACERDGEAMPVRLVELRDRVGSGEHGVLLCVHWLPTRGSPRAA
jgi:hypothetical protein